MPEQSGRGGHSDNEQDRSAANKKPKKRSINLMPKSPLRRPLRAAIFATETSQPVSANIRSRQMSPVIATPRTGQFVR